MSCKSWLRRRFSDSRKDRPIGPKRPSSAPLRVELLEGRLAPAALDWTGAAGSNWSTPGNWVQNQVPSATNNVLNFSSATPGISSFTANNDIAGLAGLTLNITDASAAKDFTITGLNAGIASLSSNKADGVASATNVTMPMTGAGATIAATAGELAIVNTANVFNAASIVNVPAGAILDMAVAPAGSLGSAQLNVTG